MAPFRLFGRKGREAEARALYLAIVGQARRPEFYRNCGVPDSLDGRFELVALHCFLVLHRLKAGGPEAADLAQAIFDIMFQDMDESLRELGAGDLGVGRRVRVMAEAFYGRIAAYEAGLAGPPGRLEDALGRNLYGTVEAAPAGVEALATYLRREAAALALVPLRELLAGRLGFGAPPEAVLAGPGGGTAPSAGVDPAGRGS